MFHYLYNAALGTLMSQPHQPKLPNVRAVNKARPVFSSKSCEKKTHDEPRDPDEEA